MKKRMLCAVAAAAVMSAFIITGCGKESSKSQSSDNKASSSTADPASSETKEALKPEFKAVKLSEDKLKNVGEYGEFTYDKFDAAVSDDDVNDYYANAVKEAVEAGEKAYEKDESLDGHVIASGDTVNLDFTGSIDGVEFEGGKGNTNLTIGSNKFIPGFEDALIGKKIGETVTIDVTFPENYGKDQLNGKAAKFECVLHYGCKEVPLTVDNAYSVLFGAASKEEFLTRIKSYLESAKKQEEQTYVNEKQQEFLKAIVDKSEFEDISVEVKEYSDLVMEAEKRIAKYYNVELSQVYTSYGFTSEDEFKEKIRESLENQLKTNVLMDAIAKKEQIEITDEYYQSETLALAQQQGYSTVAEFENAYDAEFGEGSLKTNLIASYIQEKLVEKYVKEK